MRCRYYDIFYSKLLNWEWTHPRANGRTVIISLAGQVIAFQEIEEYKPPIWPKQLEKQAQMIHPGFVVENPEKAVEHAIECGLNLAEYNISRPSRRCLILPDILFALIHTNKNHNYTLQ